MADKKDKKDKKDSSSSSSFSAFELVFFIVFFLGLATAIINWIRKINFDWQSHLNSFLFSFINFYARYVVFSFFLCIVLIIILIIYILRENNIKQKMIHKVIQSKEETNKDQTNIKFENQKWKLVEEHINSDDANKWKLAILEADIILSDLLESLKLPGEGVGEKLKAVETSDFEHIEEAWEAHKIRNAIAHQGSDFLLTQREAKRVVNLYKSVFEEFKVI